jgi:2-polyprenyl-6-methoxyphenol hydroxylase-like FAD-dependent oxidoreductase
MQALDVIIIGAGPAGTSAATLLARHGHRVLVLEREKFPRYHVGESLIPFTFQPLQRLGLIDRMRESAFVKKYSVQFVAPSGQVSQPFYFFNRYDRDTVAQTWQVLRSEFDQLLLDHARAQGAEVREQTTVEALLEEDGRVTGVRVRDQAGQSHELRARITLDCSGKESFAAVRHRWRTKDPYLNKVAVWTYYEGALRDRRDRRRGHHRGDDPWQRLVLVHPATSGSGERGRGSRRQVPDARRREGSANDLRARGGREPLDRGTPGRGAQTGPHYLTSEYSFHSRYCGREGLLLVGDAFCFLDPGLFLGVDAGFEERGDGG